ncbi:transposase-like protein [Bacillus benzoevorans]|uniref:Transposase-like protein n=1 Tax=Bacillus benzoevorans TaxID=1456 RepID=A0A7X0HW13_9BACI|nr:transposase-like protein [Bacillus benzoevorans]
MKLPKELIKEIVKEQKFTSTNQIMETIKEMFSDILEEVLQCEIDEQLGYEKHQRQAMNLAITEMAQQNGN